jgi:hypothetical protein
MNFSVVNDIDVTLTKFKNISKFIIFWLKIHSKNVFFYTS